jgi:hypothetical protein
MLQEKETTTRLKTNCYRLKKDVSPISFIRDVVVVMFFVSCLSLWPPPADAADGVYTHDKQPKGTMFHQ